MSAEIHLIYGARDPDVVLEAAKGDFKAVIVIGVDPDNCLKVAASLNLSYAEILWHVEDFKRRLLAGDYNS